MDFQAAACLRHQGRPVVGLFGATAFETLARHAILTPQAHEMLGLR